ncbi:MAG: hypothetical protein K2W85_09180 [Phycisphaerales bacterium]|nr:hypothetical protein [Phycisphaerales bacterium]
MIDTTVRPELSKPSHEPRRRSSTLDRAALWLLGGFAIICAGCQAQYSASVTNATAEPVFVQMFARQEQADVFAASRRIAPGQSGLVGPVESDPKGGVRLSVVTLTHPQSPQSITIPPGSHRVRIAPTSGEPGPVSISIEDRP